MSRKFIWSGQAGQVGFYQEVPEIWMDITSDIYWSLGGGQFHCSYVNGEWVNSEGTLNMVLHPIGEWATGRIKKVKFEFTPIEGGINFWGYTVGGYNSQGTTSPTTVLAESGQSISWTYSGDDTDQTINYFNFQKSAPFLDFTITKIFIQV